jgi:electron-transferring-flavoprotein dehydrogenase
VWALGVKEVWKVPRKLDRVIHTLGWPLRYGAKHKEFGGSWIYPMGDDRVSIGFVVGLDYTDATVSGHDLLQQFKTSKLVRRILEGGERVGLGGQGDPRGRLLGDAQAVGAGHGHRRRRGRDGQRPGPQGHPLRHPRGHPGRRGDLRAAQGGLERLQPLRAGRRGLAHRQGALPVAQHEAALRQGLLRRRRDHQRDGHLQGPLPGGRWANHRDAESPVHVGDKKDGYPKPDGKYTFDKLSSVYITGNATRDDAPNHIRVRENVPREVAEAWAWMCPAGSTRSPRTRRPRATST